jgi:hypothetical protein
MFDEDSEAWTAVGDPAQPAPTYYSSGGNPGGFIEMDDIVNSDTWYWEAPDKFLGDKSEAYGTLLTFDLKESLLDRPYDARDVILQGGGYEINMRFHSPPELDWIRYFAPLDTSAPWVNHATGQPATQLEIIHVLDSLEHLQIRGEYNIGPDTGGLDNVVFGVPAGP